MADLSLHSPLSLILLSCLTKETNKQEEMDLIRTRGVQDKVAGHPTVYAALSNGGFALVTDLCSAVADCAPAASSMQAPAFPAQLVEFCEAAHRYGLTLVLCENGILVAFPFFSGN